jgi:nitrate reductase NapD
MSEYHVCGVLLMSRPEFVPKVERALAKLSGVELHASDGGRMVVTVEGNAYRDCADALNELATLEGVASSSLVYHQIENESLPEEPQ